jgi:hypothetical protein
MLITKLRDVKCVNKDVCHAETQCIVTNALLLLLK